MITPQNDWTSRNLGHTLEFLRIYTVIQGVYSFLYCQYLYSHMKCLLPKSNQILQYGNILQYAQTQYTI